MGLNVETDKDNLMNYLRKESLYKIKPLSIIFHEINGYIKK